MTKQASATRRQVLAGAAAGVVVGAGRARAATELRYLNIESDPASVAFLKQLASDYEAATGVRVIIETIVGTTLWTKVTTAINTGRPYDIIDVAQPTQTVLLAQAGQIVPVTEVIDEAGRDDFSSVSMVKYKDDFWYFPLMYNFAALYSARIGWMKQSWACRRIGTSSRRCARRSPMCPSAGSRPAFRIRPG